MESSLRQNVLLLCHGYAAPFLSVAIEYASFFKDTPYNVIVVFLKGSESQEVVEKLNVEKVIFLDASKTQLKGMKRELIKSVKALHEEFSFEFAIAHRYKAIYIASHLKDLFVVGVAHIDGVFSPLMRKIYVTMHQRRLAILGVSKAIRDDIRNALPLLPSGKVGYLYNSLDFEKMQQEQYPSSQARELLSLSKKDFLFLNVGRLHEDKDQTTLIKAFAKALPSMPNAKLVIAGKGRLESSLKQLSSELELTEKVIFLGNIPEAYRYMKGFDCFVLSSIREGLPVALLEAFSAGLISIASRCNGNTEAIENVGFEFNIGDYNKLSSNMIKVYNLSAADRGSIKEKLKNKIDRFFTQESVRKSFWQLPAIRAISKS